MTLPVRGLIFDFDGTIADTLPICLEAFQNAVEHHTAERPTEGAVRALFGASEEGMMERIVGAAAPAAVETYLTEYARLHPRCPAPFEGLHDVFNAAHDAGTRLAIVTGKGARSAALSVSFLRLGELFPDVLAGSPQGCIKGERIASLVARWSLAPQDVAHVGDSPADVLGAREAGVRAIAAAWSPGTDREALRRLEPDELFDDVPSFARWIITSLGGES